jgi:hypothetical protein
VALGGGFLKGNGDGRRRHKAVRVASRASELHGLRAQPMGVKAMLHPTEGRLLLER